jgi:hypothetical protein
MAGRSEQMMQDSGREDLLRKYLLGLLSEDMQEHVEQQLMTDAAFRNDLGVTEAELADEYVAGELRGAEKQHFERMFLAHPSRRQQVAFARALHSQAQSSARQKPARAGLFGFLRNHGVALQAALAAACLVLVIGAIPLGYEVMRQHQELDRLATLERSHTEELQRERTERSRLEQELTSLKPTTALAGTPPNQIAANVIAFALSPGRVRDAGDSQRLVIAPGKDAVRVELLLENSAYTGYDAMLQTAEGDEVWKQKGLHPTKTPSGDAIVLFLSRNAFKSQDYAIKLSGVRRDGVVEPAATYYFRVDVR